MDIGERFRGSLLGLAVGDALGTSLEFRQRGSFEPITDMLGGGPFCLEPGQWTDDTAMALCLATSLVECGGFDARDQMLRYCRWADHGYLSSTGKCFDIGNTVRTALDRFRRDGNPFAGATDPRGAGNGCIMRLAPIALYFFPDLEQVEASAAASSRTTHGAQECVDGTRLFARMLCRALSGATKAEVLDGDSAGFSAGPLILAIARGEYRSRSAEKIRGTGYVVQSLEAALWAFDRTSNYSEAVLAAANLGEDADTTAAICGQLAGAHYGEAGIPPLWRSRLALGAEIADLADRLGARTK